MKIAINGVFFIPKGGGIKEYVKNLITYLFEIDMSNTYILYVAKGYSDYVRDSLPISITNSLKIKEIPYTPLEKIQRVLFEQRFWEKEEKVEQFDVFHSPFFYAPRLKNAKVILTVHDLRFCRYPRTYSFLRYCYLKFKVHKSLKECDKIISVSNFTKSEIRHFYGIESSKIDVIHEAINLDFFDENVIDGVLNIPYSLKERKFILYVAHIEPRKNHKTLIEVFLRLKVKAENQDLSLVIVGQKTEYYHKIAHLFDNSKDVFYLDFVEHSVLIWLYKNAKLFVFPSYYEGFGFPPLEAAALSTISAVSNVTSMSEICGDSSFYFNPFDISNMQSVISSALHDAEAIKMKQSLLKINLLRFSWLKNAQETVRLYSDLCINR